MKEIKVEIEKMIESKELQANLYKLLDDFILRITDSTTNKDQLTLRKRLYDWVMGVGVPITICDYHLDYYPMTQTYEVILQVDYKVTSGYKPYQDLDNPLTFRFLVNKEILRDIKLETII